MDDSHMDLILIASAASFEALDKFRGGLMGSWANFRESGGRPKEDLFFVIIKPLDESGDRRLGFWAEQGKRAGSLAALYLVAAAKFRDQVFNLPGASQNAAKEQDDNGVKKLHARKKSRQWRDVNSFCQHRLRPKTGDAPCCR